MNQPPHQILVRYFAIFQDLAGRAEENVETNAATPRELYEQLKQRYEFSLSAENLRVAVNDEITEWDTPLQDRDSVAFLAPFAGG
jgi:MoaD family protein